MIDFVRRAALSATGVPCKASHEKNIGFLMSASATRTGRNWCPNPIQMLLATGLFASLGVTLVILIQGIHPAPDKVTLQKDASELESLAKQSQMDDSHIEARILASATAGSVGIDRADARPEERLQSEGLKSSLIASRASSVDRKSDTDPGATREPKAFKRDVQDRTSKLRNPQRQRPVTPTRQRYEQRGLSSLFAAIGRALHFSSN